jgi:hypothetical protein
MKAARTMAVSLRQTRSLLHSAWHSLGRAEVAWVRFVEEVEALGVVRGDIDVGIQARNIAQHMQEVREVLTSWTKD